MTPEQVGFVFQTIRERHPEATPTAPPGGAVRVGVLMLNGQLFAGMAYPIDSHRLVHMEVERIAEAHLTKRPYTVYLDQISIQAITDEAPL